MTDKLFEPFKLGNIKLENRMVMASMTRGRAENTELIPNDLMVEYYKQRASAGLILTEGTWVSKESIGFINVPGIYNKQQADGWKKVTKAVHDSGGKIFSQLGHVGPFSHPDNLNGKLPVSPSAINPNDKAFTPSGFKDTVTPHEMSIEDIKRTINDYKTAAQNAKDAGFDGIEIHASHVHLIPSFLSTILNKRTDEYGGSAENRSRFLMEILAAIIDVWGENTVGVKLNPIAASGIFTVNEDTEPTFRYIFEKLNDYPLAYVHLLGNQLSAETEVSEFLRRPWIDAKKMYKGVIIAGGGFDKKSGEETLEKGNADLIAYGTPYIANPDLVERFRKNTALSNPDRDLFYSGGVKGYIDYPFLAK